MITSRTRVLLSGAFALLWAGRANAGPIELFGDVSMQATDGAALVVPYYYGGAGMFISRDAGRSFGLLCSHGVDRSVYRSSGRLVTLLSGGGALYAGGPTGLWRGDADGCGFVRVSTLAERYIGALAVDPLEPLRTYAVTSDNGPLNGLFSNDDTSDAFTAFGARTEQFLNSLHVVKRGEARRFYATGVQPVPGRDEVQYVVRVSNDEAQTWTEHVFPMGQFGPAMRGSDFKILGVDPRSPDAIVGRVARTQPGAPDSLVYSSQQGRPDSWTLVAEVSVLDAVAFGPDGALFYGDDDQDSRGLYVVRTPGAEPERLSDTWKVGCLHYDEQHARMLACSDYLFGTADLTTGELTPLVDMRCAQRFVECAGQAPLREVCEMQLTAEYCKTAHYPLAQVCEGYDQGPGADDIKQAIEYRCEQGKRVPLAVEAGSGGRAGAPAGGAGGAAMVSKTSCGCRVTAGSTGSSPMAWMLGLLVAARVRRRAAVGGAR